MYKVFFLIATLVSMSSLANDCRNCSSQSDELGECKILMPNKTDKTGVYCSGKFGVTYDGYMTKRTCYSSLYKAIKEMNSNPSCLKSQKIGSCEILMPNKGDRTGVYCSDGKFGVTYNGYMAERKCYDSLDKAMKAMESTKSCEKSDQVKNCKILYPFKEDNSGTYCSDGRFSVTYDGYMTERLCYGSIDEAMDAMESVFN